MIFVPTPKGIPGSISITKEVTILVEVWRSGTINIGPKEIVKSYVPEGLTNDKPWLSKVLERMYVDAFIHGWKHAKEDQSAE